jgi:hypothetical protein
MCAVERFRKPQQDTPLVALAAIESAALDRFREHGGVVDYVAFNVVGAADEDAIHMQAAIAGMRSLAADIGAGRAFTLEFEIPGRPSPVTIEEFVGPYYNWQRHELVDPWTRSPGGGGSRSGFTAGYADAFLDPPYSLKLSVSDISVLFADVNSALFGGLGPGLSIRRWPTDWSNYFDAGHEWWGAFFWTVLDPSRSRIYVIAASSTD